MPHFALDYKRSIHAAINRKASRRDRDYLTMRLRWLRLQRGRRLVKQGGFTKYFYGTVRLDPL